VGSTPTWLLGGRRGGTHPRSRGEHGGTGFGPPYVTDSPPLARGALTPLRQDGAHQGLTPARAGSTCPWPTSRRRRGTHPRSRGEHHPDGERQGRRAGLTPARAGSTARPAGARRRCRTHPRSRGEHHPDGERQGRRAGLTPARAGSTARPAGARRRCRTHPRSRGEHVSELCEANGYEDSPPLARGARLPHDHRPHHCGLTPARAGSTYSNRTVVLHDGTHPRSRGEHALLGVHHHSTKDSPPLARGARGECRTHRRFPGLTPARAGSTPPSTPQAPGFGTHPRSRGEHPEVFVAAGTQADSPPLARGAQPAVPETPSVFGLTPARAGEHNFERIGGDPRLDSPPLARGALLARRGDSAEPGLTPARAGSTSPALPVSRVLTGEGELFLHELDLHAFGGQLPHNAAQVLEVTSEAVHGVCDHSVAVTDEPEHGR